MDPPASVDEEGEKVQRRPATERQSALWRVFGRRVPRSEIVFVCQMILIYVVVGVSLFNLTRGHRTDNLWVALLSSSIGYILPNPSIEPRPR